MRVPNSTPIVCGQSAMTKEESESVRLLSLARCLKQLTLLLCELVEEAGLADAHVTFRGERREVEPQSPTRPPRALPTNDDVFEDVRIVVCARHSVQEQRRGEARCESR